MNPIIIFDIVGLSFSFTFAVIFIASKNRSNRARYVMIAGMTLAFILTLLNLSIILNSYYLAQYLLLVSVPMLFSVYPLLNIYLESFTSGGEKLNINLKHFILPSLIFISLLVCLFNMGEKEFHSLVLVINSYETSVSSQIKIYAGGLYFIYFLQFLFFLAKFLKLRNSVKNNSKFLFESDWIKYVIFIVISYEIIFFFGWLVKGETALFDTVLSDLLIFIFGIIGLKHDELLLELQISKSFKRNPILSSERKIKSKMSVGKKKEIISELKEIIKNEKLYLNPNLKIKNFAKRLHLPEKELSIIVNDCIGKNFTSFINEFRIAEASALLKNENIKISDIPINVGFFSKSTFNSTFKEFTGQTPTEYRNLLKIK